MNIFLTIWGQQGGGGGEIIWFVIFIIFVLFQVVRARFEANQAQKLEQQQHEERQKQTEETQLRAQANRERKKKNRVASSPVLENDSYETRREQSDRKAVLAKQLAPQGVGQRFEADPGSLDTSNLVAPTIESSAKPTLGSMTGIYETAPVSSEFSDQPLTLDIQKLIAKPEGVRQAIILAEIFKRPEF